MHCRGLVGRVGDTLGEIPLDGGMHAGGDPVGRVGCTPGEIRSHQRRRPHVLAVRVGEILRTLRDLVKNRPLFWQQPYVNEQASAAALRLVQFAQMCHTSIDTPR